MFSRRSYNCSLQKRWIGWLAWRATHPASWGWRLRIYKVQILFQSKKIQIKLHKINHLKPWFFYFSPQGWPSNFEWGCGDRTASRDPWQNTEIVCRERQEATHNSATANHRMGSNQWWRRLLHQCGRLHFRLEWQTCKPAGKTSSCKGEKVFELNLLLTSMALMRAALLNKFSKVERSNWILMHLTANLAFVLNTDGIW